MQDISGLGSEVTIVAVPTFPQGFTITDFASDSDPVVIDDVEVTNTEVGVNGDVVSWHRATTIPVEIAVIPNSSSDRNLQILVNSNRGAKNKVSLDDEITMTIAYANGTMETYTGGKIVAGRIGKSIGSDGKIRTGVYRFVFSNKI
ncbi:MAG: hypothetical protein IKB70_00265 [Bacilli bacterium]|nr:hypothetical protein [Bacilli bacterium]